MRGSFSVPFPPVPRLRIPPTVDTLYPACLSAVDDKERTSSAGTKPKRTHKSECAKRGRLQPALLERIAGIEPVTTAWEAVILPLNYIRITIHIDAFLITVFIIEIPRPFVKSFP